MKKKTSKPKRSLRKESAESREAAIAKRKSRQERPFCSRRDAIECTHSIYQSESPIKYTSQALTDDDERRMVMIALQSGKSVEQVRDMYPISQRYTSKGIEQVKKPGFQNFCDLLDLCRQELKAV